LIPLARHRHTARIRPRPNRILTDAIFRQRGLATLAFAVDDAWTAPVSNERVGEA
jgi:hypothetical protein